MTDLDVSRDSSSALAAALNASSAAVLVVDDNRAKRMALKAILLPLGHAVVEADSGEAALRALMTQDFAVILLDVRMPGMDGFETAALIRQRRQSELTPIIFVTAFTSHEMAATERYVEGAVDFIFAPVEPDELRAKVSVFAGMFGRAQGLATQARQVQESVDRLRLLTDSAPIGIFQTDAADRYAYTNPQWSQVTGIDADDALGRPWDSIIASGSSRPDHLDGAAVGAAGGQSAAERCHRFQVRREGAAPRTVVATARPLPGPDGQITGWVGTLADVTAEAEAEAALVEARDKATAASRLKSDFLATMSHEIRTPMNGVIGMTGLLLDTNLDANQRDYAETVRNSGEALMVIINDVLDFSKIEAGKMQMEHLAFPVRSVVAEAVDLLASSCQDKGLELLSVVDSAVPEVLTGDPGRVRQVLTNIMGNAIKFTSAGEIVVRVSMAAADGGDGAAVRFDVTDTGTGIADDKLETIFEPFIQADSSTSRRYGGTGLGLAICGQLVELMGGQRGVTSKLGQGSTFWFTVHVTGDTAASPAGDDEGLAGADVLVVDDSATGRSILDQYLRDWGMVVTTASSSADAVVALEAAAANGTPFAVALVDERIEGRADVVAAVAGGGRGTATRLVLRGLPESGSADERHRAVRTPLRIEELRLCLRHVLGLPAGDVSASDVPATAPQAHPHLGRVLLAEDNLVNQKITVAMLTRGGYQVDTVLDGAAAIEAAAATAYGAILMDCQMPVIDGYEATAAIRARESTGRRTPIIALTAGSRAEDEQRCLEAGMDRYLTKPISKEGLLAAVAESIGLISA